MLDRDALTALAERLGEAEGPSRELDAEIMFDLFAKPVGHKEDVDRAARIIDGRASRVGVYLTEDVLREIARAVLSTKEE